MPKISVIVPVYNAEQYLPCCIDSIINQTLGSFELILVDDGSQDNSGAICDEYAKNDKRVTVIHKKNGGASEARNAGINTASGEYIMFVDSDDYIDENMLEDMLKKAEPDVDLIISSLNMRISDKEYNYIMPDARYTVKEFLSEYYQSNFPTICFCGPVCKFYKTELINRYNIRFDENMRVGEDSYFNFSYIKYSKNVITMSNAYYWYMRVNENSLYSKFELYHFSDSKKAFLNQMKIIEEMNFNSFDKEEVTNKFAMGFIPTVVKAFETSSKEVCIQYMEMLSTDEFFIDNTKHISNIEWKMIRFLIMRKRFELLYKILKLRKNLFKK